MVIQSQKRNLSATVNGLKVSYNDEGPINKAVVIFIHGFPLNKSIWDFQLESLHDFYRVIAYDARGMGNSEPGSAEFSIKDLAEDLIEFMNVLNIEKAIVCGHSMGGYILLNAVEKYPNRFEGLILCSTQSKGDNSESKESRLKAIESIKMDGVDEYAEKILKDLFSYLSFTSKREEIAAIKDIIQKTSPEVLNRNIVAIMNRKDMTSLLSEIKIPVLIIVGKRDTITPILKSEFMHEHIENSTLELINYAGHLPNLENPWEFNRCIKKFIDNTTSAHKQPYFENPKNSGSDNSIADLGSKLLLQIQQLVTSKKLVTD